MFVDKTIRNRKSLLKRLPGGTGSPCTVLLHSAVPALRAANMGLSCLQEQVTAAIALAVEQQTQKLLVETQQDVTEFDNLLQPIIDTCTKDAISVR